MHAACTSLSVVGLRPSPGPQKCVVLQRIGRFVRGKAETALANAVQPLLLAHAHFGPVGEFQNAASRLAAILASAVSRHGSVGKPAQLSVLHKVWEVRKSQPKPNGYARGARDPQGPTSLCERHRAGRRGQGQAQQCGQGTLSPPHGIDGGGCQQRTIGAISHRIQRRRNGGGAHQRAANWRR